MKRLWAMWALGLAVTPWVLHAQAPGDAVQDWRSANETVGQFPGGYADVLRWEAAQGPQTASPAQTVEAPVPGLALPSAADAVRAGWATHRALAPVLARLGPQNADHIATGNGRALPPSLQRRIGGTDEVLEVAAHTRKAWLVAVAARQMLPPLEDALTAAEAAAELGRRMVSVGNWGAAQQAPVALGEAAARQALQRARLAARQAEWVLLKAMGLETVNDRVALPDRLPESPTTPMPATEFQQRLAAIQGQLPVAESRKAGAYAQQAYAAYTASVEVDRSQREDVLPQRERIGEATLLRYNGMLESVWGLLADAGARAQAVVAAVGAQRDALLAETDLYWVLQGGQPDTFLALGAGEAASSAAAGH